MSEIRTHLKVVAWLHIALGGMTLFAAILCSLFFGVISAAIAGGATGHAGAGAATFLIVGAGVFALVAIFAIPNLVVGWGMLNNAEWARIVGIIVSIIGLIHPSMGIGTAIAIYSLIVLFSPEGEAAFRTAT